MDYIAYWDDVAAQRAERLPRWFTEDAVIHWPCTDECFAVPEFVRANCEYPGRWTGEVERIQTLPGGAVTVTHIRGAEGGISCRAISFFTLRGDRISALTEYYADDGPPPDWRRAMGIGRPCREPDGAEPY